MYQSETAPKKIRGAIVAAYQWAITLGLLIAAIVNNATKHRDDAYAYRIPIMVQLVWAVILIAAMLVLPETPRYLIKRGRGESAARSLSRLRGLPVDHDSIVAELAEVQSSHEHERATSAGNGSYMDCFRGRMLKRTLTGIVLQALQQMSGMYLQLDPYAQLSRQIRQPWTDFLQELTLYSTTAPLFSPTLACPTPLPSP